MTSIASIQTHYIVVAIIEHDSSILFLKRTKEPYKDILIMPGGKIDPGETEDEAIEREILEETSLHVKKKQMVGFYDELLHHNGKPTHRHIMKIYYVIPTTFDFISSTEGEIRVIKKDDIFHRREEINPCDIR